MTSHDHAPASGENTGGGAGRDVGREATNHNDDGGDSGGDQGRKQLWHGRFDRGPAEELMAFTESLSYDSRLVFDDIHCSRAHVRGLQRAGVLDKAETGAILAALDDVEDEFHRSAFIFEASDEDIHTAIERRVTELAGDAGTKLHTGRSRNDQVATAFRWFTRREITQVASAVLGLVDVLADRADEAGVGENAVYLPGYTHMQQAQPVLLAHHLMAHCWALLRDCDRLWDALGRIDVSPLGAGALAGSSLSLDPAETARDIGFAGVFENSLDATADRDFVAESLACLALLGVHLSRMGEEIVLWSTTEFGFIRLDDAYATGSSMLPQKKNPDIAELARGKTGRLIGNLTGLLATMKSLPLAYNRDLQEDKEPLFDSLDTVRLAVSAMTGLYRTVTFNTDRMRGAADSPYAAATDLAEFLVVRGMGFRDAHGVVGAIVRRSLDDGIPLVDLVAAEPSLGPDAVALLAPGVSVTNRLTPGGGGPAPVAAQRELLAGRIDVQRERWTTRYGEAGSAEFRPGMARSGEARSGEARSGEARSGEPRD